MVGYTGPPVAIANLSGAAIVLLDLIILGVIPDMFKAIGMMTAILGAIIILLADLIWVKLGWPQCVPEEIVMQYRTFNDLHDPLLEKNK